MDFYQATNGARPREAILEGVNKNLVKDPKILALAAKILKQPVDKVEDKVDSVLDKIEQQGQAPRAKGGGEEKEEKVNEALGIAVTLALAVPLLLEAGGSIVGWLNKKFNLKGEELEEYKKWQAKCGALKKLIKDYKKRAGSDRYLNVEYRRGDGEDYDAKMAREIDKIKRYIKNKEDELEKLEEEGERFGGKVSNLLKSAGHGLHKVYTSPIRALLWTISLFTPKGNDLRDPKIREKVANIIYAVIMIGLGISGMVHELSHLAGVKESLVAILDGTKAGKSATEIIKDVPIVVKAFAT